MDPTADVFYVFLRVCFCVYVCSQAQVAQIGSVQDNPGGFLAQRGGFLL